MGKFNFFLGLVLGGLWLGVVGCSETVPELKSSAFTIGGAVSGLTGSGLVLQNNAGDDLAISADGTFTFTTEVATGAAYAVTVKTQPSVPRQVCTLSGASGAMASAKVSDVVVTCTAPTPKFVYTANYTGNSVSAYAIDASTGVLTAVSGSPYSTGGSSAPFCLAVDPAGKFLFVANSGDNKVSAFTISATTGALTAVSGSPFSVGTHPRSVAVHPTGRFLYVANRDDNTVAVYSFDSTTGVLTAVGSPIVAGTNPVSVVVDATGSFVYAANGGSQNLSGYSVNTTTGALTALATSPFASGAGGNVIFAMMVPSAKFLFATNSITDNISAFSLNASTGALTAVTGMPFAAGADLYTLYSAASDPTGKFIYVANYGSDKVSGFSVDATTGVLTASTSSPFASGTGPYSVSVDPSGRFLYAANNGDSTISTYSIHATTGALTVVGSAVASGSGPVSIVSTSVDE